MTRIASFVAGTAWSSTPSALFTALTAVFGNAGHSILALSQTEWSSESTDFVRGKSAKGKQVRGSGIGLSLVKHIAEAHGGSIRVEDAVPHGAVFTLRLTRRPS